jgi:hypothetical protein
MPSHYMLTFWASLILQAQLSSTLGRRTTVARTLGQGNSHSSSLRQGASLAGEQQHSSNSRSSSPGVRTGDGSSSNLSPLRRTTAGGSSSPLRQGWAARESSRGGADAGFRSGGGAAGVVGSGLERGSSSPLRPPGTGLEPRADPGSPLRQGWASGGRSSRAGPPPGGEAASGVTGSPLKQAAVGSQQQQDQVMAWSAAEEPSSPTGDPEVGSRPEGGAESRESTVVGSWQEQLGNRLPPSSFKSLQQSKPTSEQWGAAEGPTEMQQQEQQQ